MTGWWHNLVCIGVALAPVAAEAQVLDIAGDGAITRHDGPALYLTPDMAAQAMPVVRATAAAETSMPPQARSAVSDALLASAAAHKLSPSLVYALAWHESRLRPDAVSPKGAIGVMQLMPATARQMRIDPTDPAANIEGGVTLLEQLLRRYDGDIVRTLAAYDAGPAAVAHFHGVPPFRETHAYVADIMEGLARISLPVEPVH
jgi:soluble lytic murein transglycosylase-like protein